MCDLYHITEGLVETRDFKMSNQLVCFIGIREILFQEKTILMQFKSILSCLSSKKEKLVPGSL